LPEIVTGPELLDSALLRLDAWLLVLLEVLALDSTAELILETEAPGDLPLPPPQAPSSNRHIPRIIRGQVNNAGGITLTKTYALSDRTLRIEREWQIKFLKISQ